MAGPGADELVDSDPLMGFAEESGENHPEIAEVAPTDEPRPFDRLERIEQSVLSAQQELAQIRSEIATLVGTIEDIKKRASRRPAAESPGQAPRQSWTRVVTAAVGVMLGIAIGALIWVQLAGAKPGPGAAPQDQQSIASPAESAAQPEPAPADPPASVPVSPARVQQSSIKQSAIKPSSINPSSIDQLQPVSYVGTLSIDADPDGEVFVNRQDAGRTPIRLDKLRAGSHLIWIERDGYQRWTRVVQVQADHVTRLSAELEPTAPR